MAGGGIYEPTATFAWRESHSKFPPTLNAEAIDALGANER